MEKQTIIYGNKSKKFKLDSAKKKRLLEGLDDIGSTLEKISNIDIYEDKTLKSRPWISKND